MSATGTFECLCKKCGWEVTGEPAMACICHCESCRVYGGDAARVAAYPPAQFKMTKGDADLIKYESAPGKFRHSCGTCGSFVNNILPNGMPSPPPRPELGNAQIEITLLLRLLRFFVLLTLLQLCASTTAIVAVSRNSPF